MKPKNKRTSEIWAIGGGKGGIGKSFTISSIGSTLARKGKEVILIDADLGGANLHTFLGIKKPKNSLTDFFDRKRPLAELVTDSGIKNLNVLIGAIGSLSIDTITYTQKLKFFRHIKALDTDHTLIDLGAGTHFNTIDTFLLADKMIVVVVPEVIAIENMYYFLKNAFYRKLIHIFGKHGIKNVVQNTWKKRKHYNIGNLRQLIDHLKGTSEKIDQIVQQELARFKVYIVLNQVRSDQELSVGSSVKSICIKYFGLNAQYVGYIEYDDFISRYLNKRKPYMQAYPDSRCAKEIEKITEKLLSEQQSKG